MSTTDRPAEIPQPAVPPIVLILGPTAGGKTALSIALAEALPGGGEIVTADSMQVYRGMDIGTAKPTAEERRGVPHHLLDLVEPSDESFSVERWLGLAEEAIAGIRARGRWPLVVGGTNLYVKALVFGLDQAPGPDEAVRAELLSLSREERRRRLEAADPASAERIHPRDDRRTIRALEVHAAGGPRLSELQQSWSGPPRREDLVILGLDWPVDAINRRINRRVHEMMDAGLLEEVQGLLASPGLGEQARQALGYRQLVHHLEAAADRGPGAAARLSEAVEQIKIRTRRYAKQQRTWLRRFRGLPKTFFLDPMRGDSQVLVSQALESISGVSAGPVAGPSEPDRGPKRS
jgi:tRNA dimethylallyltransferase